MAYLSGIVASFLVALPALFSIVNPLGGALIYSQITHGRPHQERIALAWRVAGYSAVVMLTALLIGATLMSFFGVSVDALRVAGGLVVAASAWGMLYDPKESEDRKPEQTARAAWGNDIAFFPLTMPFTTGPGTISVAIALSASRPSMTGELLPFYLGASGAALLVAFSVGACYTSADRVVALLGPGAHAGIDAALGVFAAVHRRANPDHGRPRSARNDYRVIALTAGCARATSLSNSSSHPIEFAPAIRKIGSVTWQRLQSLGGTTLSCSRIS